MAVGGGWMAAGLRLGGDWAAAGWQLGGRYFFHPKSRALGETVFNSGHKAAVWVTVLIILKRF